VTLKTPGLILVYLVLATRTWESSMRLVLFYRMRPGNNVDLTSQRLSSMVPKTPWPTVSAMFHTLFQQPDARSVWAQAGEAVAFCEEKFPHAASYLDEALDELLENTNELRSVWKKVWSNYPTG